MNEEEFKRFYEEYGKISMRYAYKILKDEALADDVCQEVMLKIRAMGDRLDRDSPEKLHGLISVMSVNQARDYLRKATVRHESCCFDDTSDKGYNSEEFDPLQKILHMERREYQKLVLARLREKKPVNYEILMQVKYFGRSPAEVAEEFGMSINAVNNRILRARRWISKELDKLY